MDLGRGVNQHTPIIRELREERMRLIASCAQRGKANRLRSH